MKIEVLTSLGSSTRRCWGGLGAIVLAVGVTAAEQSPVQAMVTVQESNWGRTAEGQAVALFTLQNSRGMVAKITSYGAILAELHVPDRAGRVTNVVLGFDNLEAYLRGHPAFGASIGRVANRIGKARFTLEGSEYVLAANNGRNHIHGGRRGFDKRVWHGRVVPGGGRAVAVEFSYRSADGEEGYPGNLDVKITYSLTVENELRIDYEAVTDRATPVNLTNHSYFNLAGSGDVLEHILELAAGRYTVADAELIPTGEIAPVQGTPLDFTRPERIGARIEQLRPQPNGYDHNYVLDAGGGRLSLAARATDPGSGRTMEVWTTEPGVQLYTGNWLDGKLKGVGGVVYPRHGGFCLETQHFPDSINRPEFPSVVLTPGRIFRSTTAFRFAAR